MISIHASTQSALAKSHKRAVLLKFDYTPQPIFITNGPVDINYNGQVYKSSGQILGIGSLRQTIDIRVSSSSITFDAVDPTQVALLLGQSQQGRDVTLSLAILNDDYSIIGDVIPMQSLIIDGDPEVVSDPKKSKATVKQKLSTEFANWQQKGGTRTTPSSLQRHAPGDTGFDFAAESGKMYKWGRDK